jgi:hypothetical protein
MITNLVTLSITLLTNSQQAIVGEANGKALVAVQDTVIRRTITLEDVVLTSTVTTNAIGFAFPQRPAVLSTNAPVTVAPPSTIPTNIMTNSSAHKRRLEREQRMRSLTNAPPQQTK